MNNKAAELIRKLWHFCNVLRDDGLSYPDYVEQLTYLIFLKMASEQTDSPIPAEWNWQSFSALEASAMHLRYTQTLTELGKLGGTLGLIFKNARNKIRDAAKLRLLIVDLIGKTDWSRLSADVKGDAYEGLLEKNARDTKSGAGQYFTPRPLVDAIVECIAPQPGEVVADPACGTAGFLLAAHRYVLDRHPSMTQSQRHHLTTKGFRGVELVEEVARLATMNVMLHGIGVGAKEGEMPISCSDSLGSPPSQHVDVVLTNPPFGVKGTVSYGNGQSGPRGNDELTVVRSDFWAHTANKQLNFLQHIHSLLKPGGRAAVVVPDNVLFESGAAATIRRKLLRDCEVHTILRLPTGIFYAQSVKSNVIFFDKRPRKKTPSMSEQLWVYDLRSEQKFSLKTNPLTRSHLDDFVRLYAPQDRHSRGGSNKAHPEQERWRSFDIDGVLASKDCRLDLSWHKTFPSEVATGTPRLQELSSLIENDLMRALEHVRRAMAKPS